MPRRFRRSRVPVRRRRGRRHRPRASSFAIPASGFPGARRERGPVLLRRLTGTRMTRAVHRAPGAPTRVRERLDRDAVRIHVVRGSRTRRRAPVRPRTDGVDGDLFQVCAEKHTARAFDSIVCQNESASPVDSSWPECAAKVGIPASETDAVRACAGSEEGAGLLASSFAASRKAGAKHDLPERRAIPRRSEGRGPRAADLRDVSSPRSPRAATASSSTGASPPTTDRMCLP